MHMPAIIAALFGLILGSFLSVLLERLPKDKPGIVGGHSECPHCHRILAWYDLIPLLSYVLLWRRCRYCRVPISFLYPLLELAMAITLGLYTYIFGLTDIWSVIDLIILFGLVALFFFDLRYQLLPDIITLPLIGLTLIKVIPQGLASWMNIVVTGAILMLVFGLTYKLSHGRWLGLGDVKLAMLMGLLFGYPVAISVTLVAIWAGALVGLGLIIAGRANMKTPLPFGSFWTFAAIIAILMPDTISRLGVLFLPVP